jgi:hypothetical protein
MNLPANAFYDDDKKHLNLWCQGSIFIFILLVVNLILAAFNQRMLADEAVWVKPIKFEISLIIHFFTLSLLASFLSSTRRNSKLWKGMSYLVVGSGVFEVLYIFLQAARGRESHFNITTALESAMYGLMGLGAFILVLGSFYLGYLLYQEYRAQNNNSFLLASALGLTLGSILTLVIASYMSSQANYAPAFATQQSLQMPLLGWYLNGQDLRIPHFLATHMMQLFPLYGIWLVSKNVTASSAKKQLLWSTGIYSFVVLALFGMHFVFVV